MKIHLIRHGQTDANLGKKFCGVTDVSLNAKGKVQAEKIAEELKDYSIDAIWSSDLKRAYRTAQAINQYHELSIQKNIQLREMNFGLYENMSFDAIEKKYPGFEEQLMNESYNFKYPSGESLKEAYDRANAFLDKCLESPHDELVIVAHAVIIQSMITRVISGNLENYWRIRINNATLNTLVLNDEYLFLECLNRGQ